MWMRREQDPPVGCCVCRLLLLHVWWWGGDRLQKNGQEVGSNDNAQLLICSRWPSAIPLCGETMTRTMRAGASWLPWTSNTSSATWCCSQVDRSEDKFTFWAKGWIQTLGRCSEDAVSENGSNAWQPERLWRHVNPRFRSTFYFFSSLSTPPVGKRLRMRAEFNATDVYSSMSSDSLLPSNYFICWWVVWSAAVHHIL